MSDWYYAENNEQRGPVLESELKGLLAGKLPGETLVWKEGMSNWTPASQVSSLSSTPAVASATATSNPESATPLTTSDIVGTPEALEVDPDDAEKNKIFGVIAYLWILCVVPAFVIKGSPFAKYHGNQGLALFILDIIVWIVLWMLELVFELVMPSGILGPLLFVLSLVWLPLIGLAVLGIINAAKGKCVPLPLIGGFKLIK